MEALQAAIALSETISVDSDTSKIMEAGHSQQRRRKQAKPLRGLDSTEAPTGSQPSAAARQQQSVSPAETSSGDSPILNNHAGVEETVHSQVQQVSSKGSSKNSPAQRQGPCGHCKTPYSPQWRKGPRNKPVLCNACGIRYLRNRHLGRLVPQKKRTTAKATADDSSAGEASVSVDTLTGDTTDMRGSSKKRKTRKGDMVDEDTSTYSYDPSLQETLGSVGSFQQMLIQRQHYHGYSDTDHAGADADKASGRGSDVSRPDNGAGDTASMQVDGSAGPAFSTSLAMPGNMHQQLLAPMQSLTSSSGIHGGGYSMALALQLYQQQQQQLLLNQHHLLVSQASLETAGLQSAGSVPSSSTSGGSFLQTQDSSGPGSPAHSSTGQIGSAQAAMLLTQSLQMQQLQGYSYLLQQHQQQQHAHVLQAASMLHGPSPLSVMSSGSMGSLRAGNTAGLASLLQAPVSTAVTAALPAVPSLKITPLVCGIRPVSTGRPAQAAAAAVDPAASTRVLATTGPPVTGAAVPGSFQNLPTA